MTPEEQNRQLEKMEKQLEKRLIIHYKDALEEMRGLLGVFYAKHAKGETLTLQEARRMNRLKQLESQLIAVLDKLTGYKEEEMYAGLAARYAEAYYLSAYAIEQAAQVPLFYALLNQRVVEKAVMMTLDKMTLKGRLREHRKQIVNKIRKELTLGLIKGEGYSTMANRIKGVLDGDAKKARAVARTEASRVQNHARYGSYEHAVNQGVRLDIVWSSTLDSKTRESHQKIDNARIRYGDYFVVGGYRARFPHDSSLPAKEVVNCRCSSFSVVTGKSLPLQRRARNPLTGKNELIEYQSYAQWKKSLQAN